MITNLSMRNMAITVCAIAFGIMAAVAIPASADTLPTISFESPDYNTGTINGQQGWMKTGPYDAEVVSAATFPNASGFGFDAQSLRISNAVTSGSFGDQTFSPGLSEPAKEGTATDHFEATFSIGSTLAAHQPGLSVSVSPDDGNGSRMSFVRFEDQADGIHVIFFDATNPGPLGTASSFNSSDVATLDRTSAHTIKFEMDLISGPANDVVRLYVDGVLEHTGGSWEDYYRFDPEQNGNGNVVPSISKLIFMARGTAAPDTSGEGYLIDAVSLSSSSMPEVQPTGEITNPATNGAVVSSPVNLTATYTDEGDDVDSVQWAVRTGITCNNSAGTVLGNVDGHSDVATWDGQNFTYTATLTPGEYCFVFNPTDDPGQDNVRETRTFTVEEPVGGMDIPEQCAQDVDYNLITGTNGSNVINGTNGPDLIMAMGGSDVINGGNGNDCIVAGAGSDVVHGNNGQDVILGGAGSDSLFGDNAQDKLYGQGGSDSLRGGNGNDELVGGGGSDAARGEGGGQDMCSAESENTCEL